MGAAPSWSVSSVEPPGDLCATRSGESDGGGGDFGRRDADFVGTGQLGLDLAREHQGITQNRTCQVVEVEGW